MPPPRLPAELLDHIVDLLHDEEDALKSCCLASRSWISRTRRHLFDNIRFHTAWNVESWKDAFPDPSTSPACYTKTLFIGFPQFVTAVDAGERGWISTFSQVIHLELSAKGKDPNLSPFHGFSPVVKSLHMILGVIPPSQIFDLIYSFPLLEDLSVIARDVLPRGGFDTQPISVQPSCACPPAFTGFLKLSAETGMDPIASRLLSPPSSLHFWRLDLTWKGMEDVSLTTALVERCHSTLEILSVECSLFRTSVLRLGQ